MPDEKTIGVSEREAQHFLEVTEPGHPERGEIRVEMSPVSERVGEGAVPSSAMTTPIPQKISIPVSLEKTELRLDIERVLEEDLAYMYADLPEKQRIQFRAEGEKVAERIERMIVDAKIQFREMIALIREWLLLIPGVNKFFAEQEAKNKADKIVVMKDLEF